MEALYLLLGVSIYIIPSFISWNRKNGRSIAALNIFLGWTFIGWVGALIWALSAEKIK